MITLSPEMVLKSVRSARKGVGDYIWWEGFIEEFWVWSERDGVMHGIFGNYIAKRQIVI